MAILAGVIFIACALALINTILALALIPRMKAGASPSREPFVSIIVPARNEARVIDATVRAFLAQQYPNFEVIVVNDRSTDATGAILDSIRDERLIAVHGEEPPDGWLGKPWALQQGGERAKGELLLIADADIIYEPQAVRSAVAMLEETGAALIAIMPRFEIRGFWENVAMPMLPFTFFAIMPTWLHNLWQSPPLGLGAGSGNLVRRDVFERMGRFAELKSAVVDDISFAQRARHHGGRTLAVRADDFVHVRMYHGAREIIDGFTKNTFPGVGRSYIAAFFLVSWVMVCYFFPYVLALGGSALAIASVVLLTVTRVLIFRSVGMRLDSALFLQPLMLLFWAYIFLRSIWITGIRRQLPWRGRVYDSSRTTRFGAER